VYFFRGRLDLDNIIDIEELSNAITRELESYCEEIQESTDKAADIVTKQLVEDIKEDCPTDKGNYKKSWTRKKLKYSMVVFNKKYGWLTHLLEFGYTSRNGKRVQGKKHIANNERIAVDNFEDMVVAIISEGVRLK